MDGARARWGTGVLRLKDGEQTRSPLYRMATRVRTDQVEANLGWKEIHLWSRKSKTQPMVPNPRKAIVKPATGHRG